MDSNPTPDSPILPSLQIERTNDSVVVRFRNCTRLDNANIDALSDEFSKLEKHKGEHIILDLQPIEYLTSASLSKLLILNRTTRSGGGRLTLANPLPRIRELLAATRVDEVINIMDVMA
jgi:anti-anti-sigma factor